MIHDFQSLDFTISKYDKLCHTILNSGYSTQTIFSYLTSRTKFDKVVVLRHDVDRKRLECALRIASVEHNLGIQSTYYFRYPKTFNTKIIKKIEDMGHEIGYHYEVLSKAKGNYEKAISLFNDELTKINKMFDVKTICMHGSPMSKYDNRDIWKFYDFRKWGIVGEAYLSLNGDLLYFSDTGRNWSNKNKIRDFIENNNASQYSIETTSELIDLIRSKKINQFYLLSHPENWSSNISWHVYLDIETKIINVGKKVIRFLR